MGGNVTPSPPALAVAVAFLACHPRRGSAFVIAVAVIVILSEAKNPAFPRGAKRPECPSKINPPNLHKNRQREKCLPAAHKPPQTCTVCHAKSHALRTDFRKNPCKNHTPPRRKKSTKYTAKDPDPSQSKPPAAAHTQDRPRSPSPLPLLSAAQSPATEAEPPQAHP